jgi:hypothetical protein
MCFGPPRRVPRRKRESPAPRYVPLLDTTDVRVTNTAAEAVPVAVQGTPSVNVARLPSDRFQKHVANLERPGSSGGVPAH